MFVILLPHSNANLTDMYRIVEHDDWYRYHLAVETQAFAPLYKVYGEYHTYVLAEMACNRLNDEVEAHNLNISTKSTP